MHGSVFEVSLAAAWVRMSRKRKIMSIWGEGWRDFPRTSNFTAIWSYTNYAYMTQFAFTKWYHD